MRIGRNENYVLIKTQRSDHLIECWTPREARKVTRVLRSWIRNGGSEDLRVLNKLARFVADRANRRCRRLLTEFAEAMEDECESAALPGASLIRLHPPHRSRVLAGE